MEELFTATIDIEFSSLAPAGFTFENRYATAMVKYGIIVETRAWGIKGISFWVPEQEINLILELVEDGDDSPESFDCKVLLKSCTIEIGSTLAISGVCPKSLELIIARYKMIPSSARYLEFEAEAEGKLVFEDRAS